MSIRNFFRAIFHLRPVPKAAPKLAQRAWEGDGTWPFIAVQDGADIVLRPRPGASLISTRFGGDNDPNDDGRTASGVLTKGHPDLLGCALPMNYTASCAGSPLPLLPWKTNVTITRGKVSITVPLIDVGPNKKFKPKRSLDLSNAAFLKFAPLREGVITVDSIRIHGVAHKFTK